MKNKKFWEQQSGRPFVKLIYNLATTRRCPFCKKVFDEIPLVKREDKTDINDLNQMFKGEFLAHIKTTHGYDPEIFLDMIRMTERKYVK